MRHHDGGAELPTDARLLISEHELLERCRKVKACAEPPPPITTVGVVTRDRPESLQRCLQSYMENVNAYGRTSSFVVMDDSERPERRGQTREMLRELKRRYGMEVAYAGEEEKRRFAGALIAGGDLPPEVVEFALFDAERYGHTCGANRNSLLLHTAGEMFYSTDDDMVCRLAVAPEEVDEQAFAADGSREMEWWFFPDREAALASARFVRKDVLGIHETLLGKDYWACAASSEDIGVLNLDDLNPQSLRLLRSGGGKVAVTFLGIIGDSGMPVPAAYRRLSPRSRARLARVSDRHSGLTSREVLGLVPRPRIRDKAQYVSGTAVGYDNRELLPPFMPVGRGQDGVFMHTLRCCSGNSYFGDLPWAILHAPMEARAFSSEQIEKTARSVPLSKIIRACVQSLKFRTGLAKGTDKLSALGSHLVEVGSLTLPDFEEFVRIHVRQLQSSYISSMENYIQACGESLGLWARDLEKHFDIMRTALPLQKFFVPPELLETRGADEARLLTQRLVLRFGQLLCAWPEMAAGAKRLRAEGKYLAVTV